jgi:glycolate oxidase FAD binding subunit
MVHRARPGVADVSGGPVAADRVVNPGTLGPPAPSDTSAVRDIVRAAIDRGTPLRIIGQGTWLDAGRPVAPEAHAVALGALTGIVDYTPGDLTLTARAGTTLAEIAEVTRANGQWLALAPWGGDRGSLGATAATASAGPVSGAFGTPRDILIGLEAVSGTGDVIRGGGRVVKNVAGFDLTRLMVGAWGTLGIITEVSVRLRGLPEHDLTIAMPAPPTHAAVADLLAHVRGALAAPIALELIDGTLADRLGLGGEARLLARLTGNEEAVVSQREAFASFADVVDIDASVWNTLRTAEPAAASVVRLSSPVARFAETWTAATRLTAGTAGAFAHASVLRSVARVVVPNGGGLSATFADALRTPGKETRIFERLPAASWPTLASPAVIDKLSLGIRKAFDPDQLLNPGILGERTA